MVSNPRPKVSDGVLVFAAACLMGAPIVFPHLTGTAGQLLFWGGLLGMVGYVPFRWGAWLLGLSKQETYPTMEKPGASIGRDNMGTQQVFHGPVTVHNTSPSHATFEADIGGKINAANAEIPSSFGMTFAKASTGGQIIMPGVKVVDMGNGTFKVEVPSPASLNTAVTRSPQSLREAARLAYEAIEGSPAEALICGLNRTPEERISYFEFSLLSANVKMFGKKLPSSISRQIPPDVLDTLHPIKGENGLQHLFDTEAVHYIDVTVDGDDLHAFLDDLRVSSLSVAAS